MRIAIDLQGAQTDSRFRGIGRYTLGLVKGLLNIESEHEFFLLIDESRKESAASIRKSLSFTKAKKTFLSWRSVGNTAFIHRDITPARYDSNVIYQKVIELCRPDVLLNTSFFEGYHESYTFPWEKVTKLTHIAGIAYDFIPYENPKEFFVNTEYKNFYYEKLDCFKKFDLLCGISDFTTSRIGVHIPNTSKVSISSDVASHFKEKKIKDDESYAIRNKYNIRDKFVLYSGGGDVRKNITELIEAYGLLKKELQNEYQLVIVCGKQEEAIARLKDYAKKCGIIKNNINILSFIDTEDLICLYNSCSLFCFPSKEEGFGLTPLEAMRCGAPVICANATSLPEVMGYPDALFDPDNPSDLQRLLEKYLINENERQTLIMHGKMQQKKFSWNKTARNCLSAIEKYFSTPKVSLPEKTRQELLWEAIFEIGKLDHTEKQKEAVADALIHTFLSHSEFLPETHFCFPRLVEEAPEKINWQVEGPFDSSYSLALVNREFALAMSKLADTSLFSTEGPGDFEPNKDFLRKHPLINTLWERSKKLSHKNIAVASRNLYPPRVNDMGAAINMLHCYGWEEGGFPRQWVKNFNSSLHCITTLSAYVKKVLYDNGVTSPVFNVGTGTDHWENVISKPYPINAKRYRFIHVSSCFPRKGADTLVEAFCQAFTSKDDVSLIIKTFPNPHNTIKEHILEARKKYQFAPDIQVIEKDLSPEELRGLMEECHTLVAPSRGEGFGLPFAEAFLSGLSVITTNWSGQTDFCNEDTAWLVDFDFAPVQSHFNLSDSVWAEPKVEHLAQVMREVYEAPESVRQKKIEAAKTLLRKDFTWRRVAERNLEAVKSIMSVSDLTLPKIGVVTTWNTKCGIATYSEHLTRNFAEPPLILANKEQSILPDGENVIRCWTMDNDEQLRELEEYIHEIGLDVVVFQFNYGFFNIPTLNKLLLRLIDRGVQCYITLHCTIDPKHDTKRKLEFMVPALKKCTRVMVHSVHDLNRLKNLGVFRNTVIIPHGILWEKKHTNTSEEYTIASYGFLLPHKGLQQLLHAFYLLKQKDSRFKLIMCNALHPAPESQACYQVLKDLVALYHLEDSVEFHTDFLPDKESMSILRRAKTLVFPYQNTNESASGAVRMGLSTGLPVAATPLPIFDDVKEAVHTLPGTSPEDLADGIYLLMNKIHEKSSDFIEQEKLSLKWREDHSYDKISNRLYSLIFAEYRDLIFYNQR